MKYTTSEITELSSSELSDAIEEELGWQRPKWIKETRFVTREMALDAGFPEMEGEPYNTPMILDTGDGLPPHWADNLEDSMRLIDYYLQREFGFSIGKNHADLPFCTLDTSGSKKFHAYGNTIPEAICRAWLMWRQEAITP